MHSLFHIEKAIRASCVIDPKGNKYLETIELRPNDSKSVARILLAAFASSNGYKVVDICDYLDCSLPAYSKMAHEYRVAMKKGEQRIQQGRIEYDLPDALDVHLKIYRKSLLVNNYLSNLTRKALLVYDRAYRHAHGQ